MREFFTGFPQGICSTWLAAGVQQRLVRIEDLTDVVAANQRLRRRALIRETLGDIAGGAQALSELDFTRLVVRAYRLPEPQRQVRRKDAHGRNRYLDVVWEKERLVVEIDGAQHADPLHTWDDMSRDNELVVDGYRCCGSPPGWCGTTRSTSRGGSARCFPQVGMLLTGYPRETVDSGARGIIARSPAR